MFDKLVVSEPDRADFKDRRKYFMVSSVVVGILFATAVVVSIFAADYGIGSGSFELTEMIAPVDMAAVAPQVEPPRPQTSQSHSQSNLPTPTSNMSSVNEPNFVPPTTSTVANAGLSREILRYGTKLTPGEPSSDNGTGREPSGGGTDGGLSLNQPAADRGETETLPPPIVVKPKPTVSKGVVNGSATSLPKPEYSQAARAVGAQGKVDVQVTIDEGGTVISARAISGHPLLRTAAESAARRARFSQTKLSDIPVKVTGVIVYNFIR